MESFTSLQRCLLSLAFQSTHQICDTSKGSCHYRNDLYHFEFPQSSNLSWSPGTFSFSPFLWPLLLRQLVQYRNIDDYPLSFFLVNKNYVWSSCLYHVVTLNTDIPQHFHFFIFHCSFWDVFISFFRVFSPFFLQRSQLTFFATLSCCLLYSFWATFSHPLTKCCTLSPFFPHIICAKGFHWSYRCSALYSLSWWPVPVQYITTLLFRSDFTFG